MTERVEIGVSYTGWPVRARGDYAFGLDVLSEDLVADCLSWVRWFNRAFSPEDGWVSAQTERSHFARGRELRDRLQRELGAAYVVELTGMYPGTVGW
ncbi:hypothetical protein [Microbacterium sp. gxy059]|uniref:hypothetical protein n=1 Tax=Microbacterium sp. gxy059 TaxID=2957199 RepID=UPI003D99AFF3